MNIDSEFKKLITNFEKIKENYDEENYSSFYDGCFNDLNKFINNKISNPLFKNRNIKYIVDHFDEILPYINQSNLDIIMIHLKEFIKYPNFKSKFIQGLEKYPYKEELELLFYNVWVCLNENDDIYNKFVDKEIIDELIKLDIDSKTYGDLLNRANEINQKIFLNELIKNKKNIYYGSIEYKGNNKKIIIDNIDEYLEGSPNLYNLLNFVKEDETATKKVKDYIDKNEDQAINSIFTETENLVKIKDGTIKEVISLIIKDVLKNENVKLSDIKYNGGGFSRILLVGDKVIKLGSRATKTFPNNPYIVAPLLRRDLESNDEKCFIEVTERVDTNEIVTNEELYQLFKNIRDIGLVWTDVKPTNVGRLNKENIIHWRDNINPSNETLGLDNNRENFILNEGDLVILDADFIFDENDPNIQHTNNKPLFDKLESRYQKEKNEIQFNTDSNDNESILDEENIIHR